MIGIRTIRDVTRRSALLAGAVVLLAVNAAGAQSGANADGADNIVVILDASGSMAENMPNSGRKKMDVAKEALLRVTRQVEPGTNVGLLVFSGSNKPGDWVYPLGPLDMDRFEAGLTRLSPNGGTPLGEYIRKGSDRLLEKRNEQHGYGTYRLLIVTDGQASDQVKVQKYTPDALSRGIVIDVIGVAMASDHALATRVHNYRRANDPEALRRAILASVAEIGSPRDDAATDDESFALIAALPDGMAEDLLGALTTQSNEPVTGSSAWTASTSYVQTAAAPSQGSAPPKRRRNVSTTVVLVVVILVVMKIFRAAARKAKS
jgi:uncharacterized protein YegL